MVVSIERLCPGEFPAARAAVAALRIEVFRSFPYLYDGDVEYESKYLEVYERSARAVWIIARDGDDVVGASTALPLIDEDPSFAAPFVARGTDPATVFYFGESVLRAPYRGRGIGHRFFDEREAHARAFDTYTLAAFAAIERGAEDPRRPADHRDLAPFWRRRGYERQADMRFALAWRELGETEESPKTLTYWTRRLT